ADLWSASISPAFFEFFPPDPQNCKKSRALKTPVHKMLAREMMLYSSIKNNTNDPIPPTRGRAAIRRKGRGERITYKRALTPPEPGVVPPGPMIIYLLYSI